MRNKISKGSWAGKRIITVGDYAYDEYPENYVRANGIPDKHDLNFGHIVLFQTCWSTDPSVTINCKEELNREPWAGHRLEITTIDCIDKDAKDVSEE
ncbi:hypothetical protein FB645_003706, partial [Coemansia sp. IMI 203386]